MVPSVAWVTSPMMWKLGSIGNLSFAWHESGPVCVAAAAIVVGTATSSITIRSRNV